MAEKKKGSSIRAVFHSVATQNPGLRTRETAQSVKCLLQKHENLSLDPWHPYELGVVAVTLALRWAETGKSPEATANRTS